MCIVLVLVLVLVRLSENRVLWRQRLSVSRVDEEQHPRLLSPGSDVQSDPV